MKLQPKGWFGELFNDHNGLVTRVQSDKYQLTGWLRQIRGFVTKVSLSL